MIQRLIQKPGCTRHQIKTREREEKRRTDGHAHQTTSVEVRNIHGLYSSLGAIKATLAAKDAKDRPDILVLLETMCLQAARYKIPGYYALAEIAAKQAAGGKGRPAGGILVLFKESYAGPVQRLSTKADFGFCLVLALGERRNPNDAVALVVTDSHLTQKRLLSSLQISEYYW